MKQILIVDDIPGWINHHKEAIHDIYSTDVIIKTAYSASEAYDIILEQEHLDIIISDLQMEGNFSPKYDGEWLIEQIKSFSTYKDTKIIIISGAYNIKEISDNLKVNYIPKKIAMSSISSYKEILK